MTRIVNEWIGSSDDTAIPPRVKVRLFEAAKGRCEICSVQIRPGNGPEYDHIVALINGGENRESNIAVVCIPCHRAKTRIDVAAKSKVYAVKSKHLGVKKSGRPMPGSRASGFKKCMSGEVVRR